MQYDPWYQAAHNLVREEVEKQIVKYREEKKSNALMEEWEEHGSGNDLTPPQRQKYYIREGLQWQGYLS